MATKSPRRAPAPVELRTAVAPSYRFAHDRIQWAAHDRLDVRDDRSRGAVAADPELGIADLLRQPRHVGDGGSDVPAAVLLVPLRCRELPKIDGVALEDVLEHRPIAHLAHRHGFDAVQPVFPGIDHLEGADPGVHPERKGEAAARPEGIDEDPVALRVAGNGVEQDRRRLFGMMQHLRDPADVFLPRCPLDAAQLTQPEEQTVLRAVARFPSAVASAVQDNEPSTVARHLLDLAAEFSKWYTLGNQDRDKRVLVDDTATRAARMALTDAVRLTLASGLSLLGIPAPENM